MSHSEIRRCCDLVMKGGITSGILYPPAIARIAEKFYFVGIGGTSAGAIGSSLAAAAEYRRRRAGPGARPMAGFERLEQTPRDLAGPGRLPALFRPDRTTRKLFDFLMMGLTPGKAPWYRRLRWKAGFLRRILSHKKTLHPVIENGFGLCTGMGNGNREGEEVPPLTVWLADLLDEVAGRPADGVPLTFGDLRSAPQPQALRDTMTGIEHSIDLRAVTTCLTFGRPYLLPFDDVGIFSFDETEWRQLFPKRVIDYLVETAKGIHPDVGQDGKYPLPTGDKLPVIVATRMSLSFPVLFSLVPLWAVDYNAKPDAGGEHPLRKVWFSDGGITSNLPIHFFDSLYPRWPTLALNLQYTDKSDQPSRSVVDQSLVYLIQRAGDGTRDLWQVFDDHGSMVQQVVGFLGTIFRSAQVWHDHGYLRLPGYRDRVAEIWLRSHEGGLNLAMQEQTIKDLIERGNVAGTRLRARFSEISADDELGWDKHRWTRFRSGMEGLVKSLRSLKRSIEHPMPDDLRFPTFLRDKDAAPHQPFESDKQAQAALAAINALLSWIDAHTKDPTQPFHNGPRPPIEVGGRAPM